MIKVAHITDLHLGKADEVYLGLHHYQRFEAVLQDAKAQQPDAYVFGGDYSMRDPDPMANAWLQKELDKLRKPYFILSGNHDDTNQLAAIFELTLRNGYLDYSCVMGGRKHIFLDTSLGQVAEDQLAWLGQQLVTQRPPVIWMHHPPCPIGAVFMDHKHGLKNWSPLMKLLNSFSQPIPVFTGHYHANLRSRVENLSIFTCPPTSFFISPSANQFEQEDYPPAYQLILFGSGRELVVPRYVKEEEVD